MKIELSVLTLLFICLRKVYSENSILDLVILNTKTALCLDGSPAGYYISQNGDPSKIIIYFEGGGWCADQDLQSTYQSCYKRSQTVFGSSKNYTQKMQVPQGVLSSSYQNNFKDWTKVLLMYCDGSGHQGTRKKPLLYKKTHLYFRGHNITVQQLDSLQQKIGLFSKAKQVVVSGISAGGLAVFYWTNYIAQRVKNGKVWSLPDSGIFLDSNNIHENKPLFKQTFINLMKITNIEIDPPCAQCVRQFTHSKQNCMFAENLYKHIKVPLFPIQSLYDIATFYYVIGVSCAVGQSIANCNLTEMEGIEQYKKNVSNLLMEMSSNSINGCWAPACVDHGYTWNQVYYNSSYRIPQNSDFSVKRTVVDWMENNDCSYKHIDLQPWPLNRPCSGLLNKQLVYSLSTE